MSSSAPRGSYDAGAGDVAAAEAQRLTLQATRLWTREREVLERLGLTAGQRILEVGCGTGALLGRLRADFAPRALTGVDLAEANLKRAAGTAPVARADGTALPFGDGSFDVVLFRFVLRHAPDPAALLSEARRVLVPGGLLLAVDADDGTLVFEPEPRGWPRLRAALDESARRRGGDPLAGRRLRRLLLDAEGEELRAGVMAVCTGDVPPAAFIDVFLAPQARPLDPDLLAADAARAAWDEMRAWAGRPDAFACATGFFASARTPRDP